VQPEGRSNVEVLTENDAPEGILDGRRIVVLGYGNQGRPQALNLRDSGFDVAVAARPGGKAWERAETDGFEVMEPQRGVAAADILMCLLPDEVQGHAWRDYIEDNLPKGSAVCFAHGFAVTFGQIETGEYDLVMVAPKGQGGRLRSAYIEGSGLPCLLAVEHDATGLARDITLGIAKGLGCLRVGAFETTFREEALSDLFGEQAILVGGVPALIKEAFELLVERGFNPEVAYFECMHELKIIVDLFSLNGLSGMREVISGTAAFGGLKYGERLVTEETAAEMRRIFDRIESGEFARVWLEEAAGGKKELAKLSEKEKELTIEKAGREVRKLFTRGDNALNTEARDET
jgi:ketol-acid reductoisomerase